jgi:beta-ureidopropionase / N-carbamoyl-L-amino-acid hydrolase
MSPSFDELWAQLEPIGRHSGTGGYRRHAWTAEDSQLREWFAGACAARGLDLVEDRAGNQWGWWGDPDLQAGVVTGSHLDSVPDGGAFDGPLGVVSALAAVDELRRRGVEPRRPLGVVNFVDEEGARFGLACAGSRLITGALAPERLLARTDGDGVTVAEAMRRAGQQPERLGSDPEALRRVHCFVELHVEQGQELVHRELAVAVGARIWPHGRWRVDFWGEANHAGTTRMADRRDAMIGFAELVLAAREIAFERGCLTTVGKVRVRPGGVNAIAGAVTGWLDARGPDEAIVRRVVADLAVRLADHAPTVTEESWTPGTHFPPELIEAIHHSLPDAPQLDTGAGHDAGVLAQAGLPAAMIFVRNPTGVSHAPAEHAEPADCHAGVDALATVLADQVSRPPA